MNIRVDLETTIQDGTEVVFRSPVDCSQITGLIVYFKENGNTTSQEFALADAHGNNVGDIDHLFAENVVVKVILDVAHSMAFVQNADTNAYLEGRFDSLEKGKAKIDDRTIGKDAWSSKNIVDRRCPPIVAYGCAVRCNPVNGYPLRIYVTEGSCEDATHARLTMRGKNLFDCSKYKFTDGRYVASTGKLTNYSATSSYSCCEEFIPVARLQGLQITLNHPPVESGGTNPRMAFYTTADEASVIADSSTNGYTATVPTYANFMRFSIPKKYSDGKSIQIELGGMVTSYEEYKESNVFVGHDCAIGTSLIELNSIGCTYTFTADVGTIDESGNFIAEDIASVNVEGRADPVATIEMLTNAIVALGGNVISISNNIKVEG